jgi:hypothetical protein
MTVRAGVGDDGGVRHLSEQQTLSALRRGASVEQMLTHSFSERSVRWLVALPEVDGITLRLHHVRNDGDADVLDVYEFHPVDEEEYVGEGRVVGHYPDAETVLEAAGVMGARPDRWVNAGVIQDEYAALREPMR